MTSASPIDTLAGAAAASSHGSPISMQPVKPKHVQFELMFQDSPQYRARLPLRVQIYPHDSTESIVTTVKNFYGLYPSPSTSKGVSFEDDRGNTLIARYENFSNNMVVSVRVFEEAVQSAGSFSATSFHPSSTNGAPTYMPNEFGPPLSHQYEQTHKAASHSNSRRRSVSQDSGNDRRSESIGQVGTKKARSKSSRAPGSDCEHNGYSSGDGASGSVSSRAKEQMGNTDISLENIVEGGRRKRAKFESSELPLFAPPQMPAATSNSSVSPARRIEHQRPSSIPFAHPGQHPFTHPRPLQSPQSYTNPYGVMGAFATPVHDSRRHRGSISYGSGSGILPTPDPTVGSAMSEEDKDVAMQLMRLGDMSNISHGRTSASTLDDTFSGKADAASSTGATSDSDSDGEENLHAVRRQKLDFTGANRKVYQTTESHFAPSRDNMDVSGDDADYEDFKSSTGSMGKPRLPSSKMSKPKSSKPSKISTSTKVKKPNNGAPSGPMSPNSLPAHSRKPSVASTLAGLPGEDDQPDLSSKPRCQRCRKSKKGCDRQRPCGRCRDAGLGADQCVSEDEGNGRKGRYGRHMGVPVKTAGESAGPPALLPAAPIAPVPILANDKNKKRKR